MRTGRAVKGTEFSMDENSSAPSNLTSSPASGGCVRKSRVRDSTTTTTCLSQRKSMNVEVKVSVQIVGLSLIVARETSMKG